VLVFDQLWRISSGTLTPISADDGDLVEVEPVTVIGQRMGELVDVTELVERMEAEDPDIQLAANLAAKLEADRDRYLEASSPPASREPVERLAAS
jgi:hypothetical protein